MCVWKGEALNVHWYARTHTHTYERRIRHSLGPGTKLCSRPLRISRELFLHRKILAILLKREFTEPSITRSPFCSHHNSALICIYNMCFCVPIIDLLFGHCCFVYSSDQKYKCKQLGTGTLLSNIVAISIWYIMSASNQHINSHSQIFDCCPNT